MMTYIKRLTVFLAVYAILPGFNWLSFVPDQYDLIPELSVLPKCPTQWQHHPHRRRRHCFEYQDAVAAFFPPSSATVAAMLCYDLCRQWLSQNQEQRGQPPMPKPVF